MNILNEEEDLKEAKKIIEKADSTSNCLNKYQKFTPLFRFSNENINAYYKLYNFTNKNVLTVCGSSEQYLSALSLGAKKVDVFDINKLTYYYLMLKIAAIISIEKDEYLNFLDPTTTTKTQKNIYKIIRNELKNIHVKNFWDNIFQHDYFNSLFLNNNKKYAEDMFPYLQDKNYNYLRQKLSKTTVSFKNIPIDKIPEEYHSKYDYINLSNIIDYIDTPNEIIKTYSQIFENMLNKNGICILEYQWPLMQLCNFYIPDLLKQYNIKTNNLETELMLLGKIYTYTKK